MSMINNKKEFYQMFRWMFKVRLIVKVVFKNCNITFASLKKIILKEIVVLRVNVQTQ